MAVVGVVLNWLRGPRAITLKGKHVLITGGSSGIGEAVAALCAAQGAKVTLLARKMPELQAARSRLQSASTTTESVEAVSADVTKAEDMVAAVAKAEAAQGEVDLLFCCAGVAHPMKFEDTSMSDFEDVFRVNTFGVANSVKAAYRSLTRRPGGRVVVVASQAAQAGVFGYTAYSASKFALVGFAQALQMEVRPKGVAVTVAYPPDTDTPQLQWENARKPAETKLISDVSSFFPASQVAADIVRAARHGRFTAATGLDGFMLAKVTCGMSPQSWPLMGIVEVLLMPIFRVVALVYLRMWSYQIAKYQASQKQHDK